MKKITLAILAIMLAVPAANLAAQGKYGADSAQCLIYLSYYKEYYKQKAYEDALPSWRKAYKTCPATASQNMLLDGTNLMRRLIVRHSSDAAYRQALVDTLMTLHDIRAQYYPNYKVSALNNKGIDMSNYIKNDPETLYKGYSEIIAFNKEKTKPTIFLFDMQAAIDMFNAGKLGAEEVINTYQNNLELLDKVKADSAEDAEQIKNVRTDVESLFISSKVASCEELLKLFGPRYNANPNDLALVTNIVRMMSITEGCQDNDLFLNAVTSMYKLEPSYNSAYYLYRLNAARDNVDAAIKYIEEAIGYDESDSKTDADYYYQEAAFCFKNGRFSKAYAAAREAAELDSSLSGKCFFLIGQIWGATACGGDEIGKRAHFWVAVDYLQKARAADPSLAEEAGRMIGQYSRYFPQTAEAFMYDIIDGQSYTVSCNGMTATTTVRTQK